MSIGIFFIESDNGLSSSNGAYIKYKGGSYLITCAHTFYDKEVQKIHFIIEPLLSGKNIHGKCHLENLSPPFFHKDDTEKETYEVSVIKLSEDKIDQLTNNKILPSLLSTNVPSLNPNQNVSITGYNTHLFNDEGFQGPLKLGSIELPYVLTCQNVVGPHPKSIRSPIDCYITALKTSKDLGEGFSGSIVTMPKEEQIIGIYHTFSAPLKNGFDKLTPEGGAIFCSVKRIKEAIDLMYNNAKSMGA